MRINVENFADQSCVKEELELQQLRVVNDFVPEVTRLRRSAEIIHLKLNEYLLEYFDGVESRSAAEVGSMMVRCDFSCL